MSAANAPSPGGAGRMPARVTNPWVETRAQERRDVFTLTLSQGERGLPSRGFSFSSLLLAFKPEPGSPRPWRGVSTPGSGHHRGQDARAPRRRVLLTWRSCPLSLWERVRVRVVSSPRFNAHPLIGHSARE